MSAYPENLAQEIKRVRLFMHEAGGNSILDTADVIIVANGHLSNPAFVEVLYRKFRLGLDEATIAKQMSLSVNRVNKLISNAIQEIAYKFPALFMEDANHPTLESSVRSIPCCTVNVLKTLNSLEYYQLSDLVNNDTWLLKSVRISASMQNGITDYIQSVKNGTVRFSDDLCNLQLSLFETDMPSKLPVEDKDEKILAVERLESIRTQARPNVQKVIEAVESEGSTEAVSEEIPKQENQELVLVSEEAKEEDAPEVPVNTSQLFVILKDYGNQVLGLDVSKRKDAMAKTRVIAKSLLESMNVRVINLDEDVREVLAGDVELSCMSLFHVKPSILSKLSIAGFSKFSELTGITKKDFMTICGSGGSFTDMVEQELRYRGYEGFLDPSKVVVSEKSNSSNEVTMSQEKEGISEEEPFVSVEELSNTQLPISFLTYVTEMANVGRMSDRDLLDAYSEYLCSLVDREHDSIVLMTLLDMYTEVPVGVIHVMERLKDKVVFHKQEMKDKWMAILMKLYLDEFSDDFLDSWKKDLYSKVASICLDKYDSVDLQDVYKVIRMVNWKIDADRLVYVYHNYKSSIELFIRKPETTGYLQDFNQLLNDYNKSCSVKISPAIFKEIDAACGRLNMPYSQAIEGLKQADNLHEITMLYNWFNFNYKNMSMFLKQYKDFDKIMEE